MKTRTDYNCPLEMTHDITRGKWKPIILWLLGKEPCSFSGLTAGIHGISEKMLMEQVNELIQFDMVQKKSGVGCP